MNRHQQRVKVMEAIYQYLLIDKELEDILQDLRCSDEEANTYFYDVISAIYEHEEDFSGFIRQHLTEGWSYERLGFVERAILLLSLAEMKDLNMEKAIVINEAVTLAKQYCDEETYKLINGILDAA